ncbi:transketolase [Paraphotobacterium marinum]|uniref:Transketolase n=1 Tax=Paraphotobacterium marinum TaxID=1755811 RepID=A0A220VBW8_9GAMM|nr:transketolase [Paraphotobacterium marinum]ASK77887.1 transketolase [Paraphotobacterium marinum]
MTSRQDLANAIRALSMDGVQKAKSGHPGAPMGMADIAEVLWRKFLKHNPSNPNWFNRDRFVLSNGHGSMLLYSLLHLSGYDLSIDDLKNFRQMGSKTPGHPEYGYAPGVETTTGPLGQGISNAVGMAIAEKNLASTFNTSKTNVIDHFTYVFLGDGCLMEGISHEACSLAGTLGLGKLIAFWDDNGISIDGEVEGWFSDDTVKRFESYGWQVIAGVDGHNSIEIENAINQARNNLSQPTLICCKTLIGFGSPNKAGTHDCHGAPLGEEEIKATKQNLNWQFGEFEIPAEIYKEWNAEATGEIKEQEWNKTLESYSQENKSLYAELKRRINNELPSQWNSTFDEWVRQLQNNPANIASRKASQNSIEFIAKMLPELTGGSADLAPSNLTTWSKSKALAKNDFSGNYIHYGVREFGMTAIINGISLHGGLIPFGATFLMFMEYARNALRMAALMKIQNIEVYTHDSIGLGEDGPTHQPIEQMANLRQTPNLVMWRPCDQVETAISWKNAIENKTNPTALIFSRQNLKQQNRNLNQLDNIAKGGYVLTDSDKTDLIIIATGSEVGLAVEASISLKSKGVNTRVVSMPSTNVFDSQSREYKDSVLLPNVKNRLAIEAGISDFWMKYVGLDGDVIGMNSFGESAPANKLFEHFGFTVENVVEVALNMIERNKK